jgi:hypothetical protein
MAYTTITGGAEAPDRDEKLAYAAITPGMLCYLRSDGTVAKHAVAGGSAYPLFALEDGEFGGDVDTDYDAGDAVQLGWFKQGQKVVARLYNGETAVIGSLLESAGNGYMRVVDADTSAGTIALNAPQLVALEAVDMSGSSAVDPSGQILCRVL